MTRPTRSALARRRRIAAAGAAVIAAITLSSACSGDSTSAGHGQSTAAVASPRHRPAPSPAAGPPLTGTWRLAAPVPGKIIEGFADQAGVVSGQPVQLRVSATSRYHVEAYRMGFYSGARGQLVWASPWAATRLQPGPAIRGPRRTVTTAWTPSLTVPTRGWQSGLYLFKLVGADGAQSYVPVVVRAATANGAVLLVDSAGTWQAYNRWGGASLYRGPGSAPLTTRSRAVSFDRPYDRRGLGMGLPLELPLIAVLEQQPVRFAYATDLDLGVHPEVLTGVRAVLVLGHSEYWTPAMRANLTAARDRGVHVAFLGANDIYWRARTEPGPAAGRVLICYKSAAEDPVHGAATTVRWADAPAARPANSLLGQSYGGSDASAAMVIRDPSSWLVHGTGVRKGTTLPGLIGVEYDHATTLPGTPAGVKVVAHSPVVGHGGPRAPFADMTWYRAPSGAVVVDVGTMGWGAQADSPEPAVATFVRRVTTNILDRFLAHAP